jgi:glycosyltransferase involved in cell wall biosynthesis
MTGDANGSNPPRRIAHVMLGRPNPHSANGIDQVIYHLSRCQAELGHLVALFSISAKPVIPVPGVDARTYTPWRAPCRLAGERLRELWIGRFPLNVPERLMTELVAWKPDMVHLHSVFVPQNLVIGQALRRRGIPYCVSIHGQLTVRRGRPWQWAYNLIASRLLLDHAAMIHAISAGDVARLRAYRVRAWTMTAPIGVSLEHLDREAEHSTDQRPPELRGKRVFLFLGRLDVEQKGLDLLVQAFAYPDLENTALVLVGPDWQGGRERLEREVRRLGLDRRVKFVGAALGPDKMRWLRIAEVFVHPSRWEGGVPTAVLEAAALSKPALLSAAADPAGAFTRNGAAVLVSADAHGVASGVRRFSAMDREELDAMGRRARAAVETGFTWPPIARAVIAGYRGALARES